MAKMRMEEKEAIEKHKKEKADMIAAGLPVAVENVTEITEAEESEETLADAAKETPTAPSFTEGQPGAYRPKEKRGKEGDRQDNRGRGRGRGGRGRGGPPNLQNMAGPGGPMFGMPPGPGDFRTPPFPGMEVLIAMY